MTSIPKLTEEMGPIERPAGTGIPYVSPALLAHRLTAPVPVLLQNLYHDGDDVHGATNKFYCCVFTHTDGTFLAMSLDFPETVAHASSEKEAVEDLRVKSQRLLERALEAAGVYRKPLDATQSFISIDDYKNLFGQDYADKVICIQLRSFVVKFQN